CYYAPCARGRTARGDLNRKVRLRPRSCRDFHRVELNMDRRFLRAALIGLLVLLAIIAAQPYVLRLLSGKPQTVQPRGELASAEKTAIELFERLSPSVVQVAGMHATSAFSAEEEGSGAQTGTGFVWDGAGHIVTNNHVVQGADRLAIRLASGNVLPAS